MSWFKTLKSNTSGEKAFNTWGWVNQEDISKYSYTTHTTTLLDNHCLCSVQNKWLEFHMYLHKSSYIEHLKV